MLREDGEPLQDGFRRLAGRLMQLPDHELRYEVQADHKIPQAISVRRDKHGQRPCLQLR